MVVQCDIDTINQELANFRQFMDKLLSQDLISATDYSSFANISVRLERKLLKKELKQNLIQLKASVRK